MVRSYVGKLTLVAVAVKSLLWLRLAVIVIRVEQRETETTCLGYVVVVEKVLLFAVEVRLIELPFCPQEAK